MPLRTLRALAAPFALLSLVGSSFFSHQSRAQDREDQPLFIKDLNVHVPHVSTDASVKYDYDIVYVRAGRAGDEIHKRFYTDFSQPVTMEPGADLMLLHPDGSEELLVEGGDGSITDPVISFDAQWAYYVHIHNLKGASQWDPPAQGADIYKIHLKSRKIVQLTNQVFTPNTGAGDWAKDFRTTKEEKKNAYSYGVFNMGPCPLPGGRLVFTSNRDGFRPPKGYPAIALQMFVMDDSDESIAPDDPAPNNIEKIGYLNSAGALHPVVLRDGRIIFSTLESQGIRSEISWGIWSIHPDGTNWNPVVSAFDPGGASNGFHFQAQFSDGSVVVEEYYNQNNSGFGAYIKLPETQPEYGAFGPAFMRSPRNPPWRFGRFENGKGKYYRMPFMPTGSESLTPFALNGEGEADPSIITNRKSPRVGKFTHPSGAPDNHLLTIYSPGPVNHQYKYLPQYDGGIYLLKEGKPVNEPAELRLIKNDPKYNESWPRAVVPYERIYGVKEPKRLAELANDGKKSKLLPEGTPFGLVGTSSFYKRESYPNGVVPDGKVTAVFSGGNDPWKGLDPFTSHGNGMPTAWHNQGSDVGLYSNDEIHAVRILAMEPTTDRRRGPKSGRQFFSHAMERLRILGEIPLRKFSSTPSLPAGGEGRGEGGQPLDPDGNPDTSFLARIPANTAFTFQTLDARGLVLNTAQTWHQLRPGEVRHDCGGCHAHSQKPTRFEETAAAKPDYGVWDLVNVTPLLTDRSRDESGKQWDTANASGLRQSKSGLASVEYFRDVKPIFERSCIACHSGRDGKAAQAELNLDADEEAIQYDHHGKFPGTYYRLALDERAKYGYKPVGYDSWGYPNASRTVRKFQARRSLLVWKIFGERLDGFHNNDHPTPAPTGGFFAQKGEKVDTEKARSRYDLDYTGSIMPPPAAVKAGKVAALTDEDRRTIVRWIDLGCPIDLDYDPQHPERRGVGWGLDDDRPIVALTSPARGQNDRLSRILVGLHDYSTGLDAPSLSITADFAIDSAAAGTNLADRFVVKSQGVWEYTLKQPIESLKSGTLTVSVKDKQGNVNRVVRRFNVSPRVAER